MGLEIAFRPNMCTSMQPNPVQPWLVDWVSVIEVSDEKWQRTSYLLLDWVVVIAARILPVAQREESQLFHVEGSTGSVELFDSIVIVIGKIEASGYN